ncbi:MAG: type II secretion system F family protein [Nitrospirae bacterium]|nr:type II secretion system F family protein [Magnetococcales bacterium]
MSVFHYQGLSAANGKITRGILDAQSERDARRILREKGVFTTQLYRAHQTVEKHRTINQYWLGFRGRQTVPVREQIIFTRQMATLLNAGFSVVDALTGVEEQIRPEESMRGVVMKLRSGIREGESLSEVLSHFPGIFNHVYVSLVGAGEQGGALGSVLEKLAVVMETQERTKTRMTGIMIYPALLVVVGIAISYFLMTVIVPQVAGVFEDRQQALPWITRVLLLLSHFLREWGLAIVMIVLVTVLFAGTWMQSPRGRRHLEKLVLATPLLGPFMVQVMTMRFSEVAGLLIRGGVPIVKCLRVTSETVGMIVFKERIVRASLSVEQGESLAEALSAMRMLPQLALRMIQTGEKSGNLEMMLERVRLYYQEEVDRTSDRLMQLLEPVVILVMGSVIGVIVVAVLLPIFEMNSFF